jgi:hypothetical protein
MSSRQIQCKYGISIPEFLSHSGTEAQCAEALKHSRWPQGFRCPKCSSRQHSPVAHSTGKRYKCGGCRLETSLTAGTLMEYTKLPLTTWFLASHLISQAKTDVSALALKRDLGVSYPTAWLLHHKINNAMSRQESARLFSGAVQLDDAYLGGDRSGGKPGRGSENKVPFVAAVSMNDGGQPIRLKLGMVIGFTSDVIAKWTKASLLPKTMVTSDGLGCFARSHRRRMHPHAQGGGRTQALGPARVQLEQHRAGLPQDHDVGYLQGAEVPQVRPDLPRRLRLPVQPLARSARANRRAHR